MAVEYDLVVIGNTAVGIHAAISAARLKARVALIEQAVNVENSVDRYREVGRISQQIARINQLRFYDQAIDFNTLNWTNIQKWADTIARDFQETNSPAVLGSLGIEVITASGEFVRKPQPGFLVNGRLLRSRSFLIATGMLRTPTIKGLKPTSYLTEKTAFQTLPATLTIIGDDAIGIEFAQIFARLGSQVTLITTQFLAGVDREAAFLIQAQLEAESVRVLTTQVTQVRKIQNKKWVQAGDVAIETDEILLATETEPNLEGLNLEATGVRSPLQTNAKQQTTNSRIYWCSTQHEADIAVKNALFFPIFKLNRHISKAIFLSPEIAWIGLTEAQAIHEYGKDIFVLRQPFKTLEKAQIRGEITGFCKIIVRRNGSILGAHIVGTEASELMGAIALAIQKRLKVEAIASLPFPSPTLSEILSKVSADFHNQKLKENSRLRDFLQGFFDWRRKRSDNK
jgi:pyruvate/2-oxoglutarate dehydrogenase complex dihydrolipoamide dehydrogenase (E3) component